jgi:hypothetical protein
MFGSHGRAESPAGECPAAGTQSTDRCGWSRTRWWRDSSNGNVAGRRVNLREPIPNRGRRNRGLVWGKARSLPIARVDHMAAEQNYAVRRSVGLNWRHRDTRHRARGRLGEDALLGGRAVPGCHHHRDAELPRLKMVLRRVHAGAASVPGCNAASNSTRPSKSVAL